MWQALAVLVLKKWFLVPPHQAAARNQIDKSTCPIGARVFSSPQPGRDHIIHVLSSLNHLSTSTSSHLPPLVIHGTSLAETQRT